jgi:biotin-dependent carboxylase-like uncharacterized protein
MADTITVSTPGMSVVQDLGRRGGGRVGQMVGGASDQYSARVANALVSSEPTAPLIELTALDFAAVSSRELIVAITGAPATVVVDGRPAAMWEPVLWPAGTRLHISGIRHGLRVYLAVHGSIDAPTLKGSCAPDTVLGFGRRLGAGDVIDVCVDTPPVRHPHFDIPVFRLGAERPGFGTRWTVPVTDGPDVADFGDTSARLFGIDFTVADASNHIGLRLRPSDGGTLPMRVETTEMLSRGVPIGAVEVPAGDEILVLHRGRGVTAGYPVLAVVTTVGLDSLGQARPGDTVRFTRVDIDSAVDAHRARQRSLARLRERVSTVFTALDIPDHTRVPIPRSALTLESA